MPVYSFPYDGFDYDPAMPVAQITLVPIIKGRSHVDLVSLIDSGADATILPLNALELVGARYARSRLMTGVTGEPVSVDTYLTTILVGPYNIYRIEAVAMPIDSQPILGRDVLNQLELTLNGPAQELWIA